jgi:hypothetical protein
MSRATNDLSTVFALESVNVRTLRLARSLLSISW